MIWKWAGVNLTSCVPLAAIIGREGSKRKISAVAIPCTALSHGEIHLASDPESALHLGNSACMPTALLNDGGY